MIRPETAAHRLYEHVLSRAMTSPDPVVYLRSAARDRTLPPDLRRRFASVEGDGVRLATLLVAKLRFERLVRGSADISAWFAKDPEGFAEAFRRYHQAVAPTAYFPAAEARLFAEWIAALSAPRASERSARAPRSRRPASRRRASAA